MQKLKKVKIIFILVVMSTAIRVEAQIRIKDVADIQGVAKSQIVGYSLVTGLGGTGDRRSTFTRQAIRNMLKSFGLTLDDKRIMARNVAAVMVTAEITAFNKQGSTIDVVVSSLGDASSLEGGVLLRTPLVDGLQMQHAWAQGSVSIGGLSVKTTGGASFRKNVAVTGLVPGGAIISQELGLDIGSGGIINYILKKPDFTTALRIAEAVDSTLGSAAANPLDAATVAVTVPADYQGKLVRLIARLESVEIVPDQKARVVINERTGTVVVGGRVRLSEAAVSQGDLTVKIYAMPFVSQPNQFGAGQTVAGTQTAATVDEKSNRKIMVLNESSDVNDLATALNSLNVSPREIISIFQALKRAGALNADLVIM